MDIKIENCELRSYEFRDKKDKKGQYLIIRFEDAKGIQHNALCRDRNILNKFEKGLSCTLCAYLFIGSDYTQLTITDII